MMNVSSPTDFGISKSAQWLISNALLGSVLNPLRFTTIAVALFGSMANVANATVFLKLGLKTSTNICLFYLAIADFVNVGHIGFSFLSLFIDWSRFVVTRDAVVYGLLSQIFYSTSAIASWVTTIIALERWCCVVFPLKVKTIFNKRTVVIMLSATTFYELCTNIPYVFIFRLKTVRVPGSNRTQQGVDRELFNMKVLNDIRIATFSVPTITCFSLVVMATVSLVTGLKANKKIREKMASGSLSSSERTETRVVETVVFVCVIFIAGYFIDVMKYFASIIYPRINITDPYLGNFTQLLITISYLAQVISSSANIFVYLRLMSQYRKTFLCAFFIHK